MKILGLVFFIFLALQTLNAQKYHLTDPIKTDSTWRTGKLANGIEYYIHHTANTPKRGYFYALYTVGSAYETSQQRGFAHFIEHLSFSSDASCNKRPWLEYLKSIGLKIGPDVNASTGLLSTRFTLFNVPLIRPSILDSSLIYLSYISSCVALDSTRVEREKRIIREEWRKGDVASRRIDLALKHASMPGSAYADAFTLGDTAIISKLTTNELADFYSKWFRTDHLNIIAIGDFDVDTLELTIKDKFGVLPPSPLPSPRRAFTVPDNTTPIVAIATDTEAQGTKVDIYFKRNPDTTFTLNWARNQIIDNLIDKMISQRLIDVAQADSTPFVDLKAGMSAYYQSAPEKASFFWSAKVLNNRLPDAVQLMLTENERLVKYGFTNSEFERTRQALIRQSNAEMADMSNLPYDTYYSEAYRNIFQHIPLMDFTSFNLFLNSDLPQISIEQVNERYRSFIPSNNMVVTISAPKSDSTLLPTEQEIKQLIASIHNLKIEPYTDPVGNKQLFTIKPKPGKVKKQLNNEVLGTVEWTLSNKMKVVFKTTSFEKNKINLLGFSPGGLSQISDFELFNGWQLSNLVQAMGAGGLSKIELARLTDGADLSVLPVVWADGDGFRGSCSPADFETCLQLIHLYFVAPRWDEKAFNQYKTKEIARIQTRKLNPLASFYDSVSFVTGGRKFRARSYNPTELNFEKIKHIYADRFADPSNFTFLFVGNIDPEKAKPLVEKYLASLNRSEKTETALAVDSMVKGRLISDFKRKMSAKRASVHIDFNGQTSGHTLNDIVYANFSRTILQNVCENTLRGKRKGVYGVSVDMNQSVVNGNTITLSVDFTTDPNLADDLKNMVYREMRKLKEDGPNAADLKYVKEYLLKDFRQNLTSNTQWVNRFLYEYYQNGLNLVSDYETVLENITSDSIREFFQNTFDGHNSIEVTMRPE